MTRQPAIYIATNRPYGTLYVGVTSDLIKRIWEHRTKQADGFSARYNLHRLVYYELYGEMLPAIQREKQLKKWERQWKIELIESMNPGWVDLWESIKG